WVTRQLGRVSGKRGLFGGGGLFAIKGCYCRRSQAALRLSPWRIQLSGELEQLLGGIRRSGVVPPPETEDQSDVHEVGKVVRGPVPAQQLDTLRDVLLCFVDPAAIPFCKGQLPVKARYHVVVTLLALQLKRLPPQRRPAITLANADLGLTKLLEDGREQLRPVAGPDQCEGRAQVSRHLVARISAAGPLARCHQDVHRAVRIHFASSGPVVDRQP